MYYCVLSKGNAHISGKDSWSSNNLNNSDIMQKKTLCVKNTCLKCKRLRNLTKKMINEVKINVLSDS